MQSDHTDQPDFRQDNYPSNLLTFPVFNLLPPSRISLEACRALMSVSSRAWTREIVELTLASA